MKYLAQAVAEKLQTRFSGSRSLWQGQSATKCDISTPPHEDESVYRI